MPTGYTYELLEKKQTFPQFAMSCARAFGALIEMRDDSMDAEIPERLKASTYHTERLKRAERELAKLQKLTPKERRAFGQRLKDKRVSGAITSLKELRQQNAALVAVRDEALKWYPPTEEHNGLHKFIIEQLETSIDSEDWRKGSIVDAVMDGPMDFYKARVASLKHDIAYHTEHHAKELERVEKNNAWLSALRESLKYPP